MKEEIWKVVERCPKVEVSNTGRLRYTQNQKLCAVQNHYNAPSCIVRYNGKRVTLSIAQEVWRAFGTGKQTAHTHVKRRDNDNFNCCIDNLSVKLDGSAKAEEWQVNLFMKYARPVILNELKNRGCLEKWRGWDIDNIIGEALYLGWRYLPTLQANSYTDFYHYLKPYIKYACAIEGKNGMLIRQASWATYNAMRSKAD